MVTYGPHTLVEGQKLPICKVLPVRLGEALEIVEFDIKILGAALFPFYYIVLNDSIVPLI